MANYCPEAYRLANSYARLWLARNGRRLHPLDLAEIVDKVIDRLPPGDDWRPAVKPIVGFEMLQRFRKTKCKQSPTSFTDLPGEVDGGSIADREPESLPPCYVRMARGQDRKRLALLFSDGLSIGDAALRLKRSKSTIFAWKQALRSDLAIMSPYRCGPLTAYVQSAYRTGRIGK